VIDAKAMATGMHMLGAAFNRTISKDVMEVYFQVLGARLDRESWERAVQRALECESFFPAPAVLLRYGQAQGAPQARAAELYQAVLGEFERGHALGPREVGDKYGTAAMEAFVAAGGSRAFAWCEPDDEPFRLKRWVEAWIETTEQEPSRALPPGEAPKQFERGFTREEAKALFESAKKRALQ
jgi:hypothetical protein